MTLESLYLFIFKLKKIVFLLDNWEILACS